jgi:hypothetical protein
VREGQALLLLVVVVLLVVLLLQVALHVVGCGGGVLSWCCWAVQWAACSTS